MKYKLDSLPSSIVSVVRDKGTEPPYVGEYDTFKQSGTYLCRLCGQALFRSKSKFHSGCGWPSFDEEISNAVSRRRDADGQREEILCSRCQAHLGHVFIGEGFTNKNSRHCVNSLSLDFVEDEQVLDTEEAIYAAGCFWGVEYLFKQLPGVLKTEVGYCGGESLSPTYETVCAGGSGHYEAIRVIYDPTKIHYETLTKYFFEIHDATHTNGQGPDIGHQYLSAIFYYDEEQKSIAKKLISILTQKGLSIATKVLPAKPFWRAEKYHQDYYAKTGQKPYCHQYQKKFD